MRIIKAVFRVGRVLRRPLWVTLLSLPLFLESFPALAADADKDAKAGVDAQSRAGAKKPAVRIIVLNGTYVDYPSTSDMDPMSLLLGGLVVSILQVTKFDKTIYPLGQGITIVGVEFVISTIRSNTMSFERQMGQRTSTSSSHCCFSDSGTSFGS